MKIANIGLVTILGFLLAATGIVVPISWDYYKSKSSIELHHTGNVKLIESSNLSEKVQLVYDGRPIPILSRQTFSLINTGKTPILKKDLVQPLTVTFPDDVDILEVVEDAKSPKELEVEYTLSPDKKTLLISFPLLNPSDQSQFGVLLSGYTTTYSAKARIVGISNLKTIERVAELQGVKRKFSFVVFLVGFCTLILTLALFVGGIPELIEERTIKRGINDNSFQVPKYSSKDEYINFIKATFKQKSANDLKSLTVFVNTLPTNMPLEIPQQDQIAQKIIEYATKINVVPIFITSAITCSIGWWYVISNFIR